MFKKKKWFESWGEEYSQNQNFKAIMSLLAAVVIVQTVVILLFSSDHPPLVGEINGESVFYEPQEASETFLNHEAQSVIESYVETRYNWEPGKMDAALSKTRMWVHPDKWAQFQDTQMEQLKIVAEKKIAQKFYTSSVTMDHKRQEAIVVGERIIIVDGLRAATPLKLKINYEWGPKSDQNIFGVFVAGETHISSP